MEQGCRGLLEPRYAEGVHALMVRLLGRCTCESRARVIELYSADRERPGERATA